MCDVYGDLIGMVTAGDPAHFLGLPVRGANNGVTYAMGIEDIREFLDSSVEALGTAHRFFRKHAPREVEMSVADFAGLQHAARRAGGGACGIFSGNWSGDVLDKLVQRATGRSRRS